MRWKSQPPHDFPALVAYVASEVDTQVARGVRWSSLLALMSLFPYQDENPFQACIMALIERGVLRKDWYFDDEGEKRHYYEFMGARTPENTEPPF